MWCIIVWKRIRGEKREKNDCTIYGNWAAIATLSWLCSYKECGGLQVPYPMHALCKSTQQKSFLCTQRVWRNEPTKTTNKSWEIQRVKFGKRNFPTCFSLQTPAMLAFLLACLVVLIASLPCLLWFALLFLVVVGNVGVVASRPSVHLYAPILIAEIYIATKFIRILWYDFMVEHSQYMRICIHIYSHIPLTTINGSISSSQYVCAGVLLRRWCIFRITYAHIIIFEAKNGYLKAILPLFV